MAGQAEFLERINELERIAKTNGDVLGMEEIADYFSDMGLEEAQFDYICKYLESKKIRINDRVARLQEDVEELPIEMKPDAEDDAMVSMYLSEAALSKPLEDKELTEETIALCKGEEAAASRIIEGCLSYATEVAGEFREQGLLYSDLIQEANIALMLAVTALPEEDFVQGLARESDGKALTEEVLSGKETLCRDYLGAYIRRHLQEELGVYNASTRSAMKMAGNINSLNEHTMAFAQENGREAKPDELARIMGVSEEEIREWMKVSLDAVSVMGSEDVGDMDQLAELAEGGLDELDFDENV